MATTSPDNIQYPVNSDQVAPLASHFKNLADSTQAALNNIKQTSRVYVKNGASSLTKGTPVYITGADGTNVIIGAASNASEANSSKVIGLTETDLTANAMGYVVTDGRLTNIDTSGAGAVGDPVWLGVDGAKLYGLANKPVAPAHMVYLGVVSRKNANNGEIEVKVQNGFELEELHNVLITNPQDKQVVAYEGGLWKNKQATGGVTVGATAPAGPNPGDAWYNSNNGMLYVWYVDADSTAQWVQVKANSGLEASILSRLGSLESQAIAYGAMSPNYIINGAFDINQRAFTSTTTNAAYGFDRWLLVTNTGTSTYSAQSFGTTPVITAGVEGTNFARLAVSGQSGTSAYSMLRQNIENVKLLAGKTVTVSFWAKAASGTPYVAATFEQFNGTSYSRMSGKKVAISTSWARYSMTFTIPSVNGQTVGADNITRTGFELWCSAGSDFNDATASIGIQSNTFDIWGVQVENGSVATAFRRNQQNIQAELAACQRYYWRRTGQDNIYSMISTGFTPATAATAISVSFQNPVEMRGIPHTLETSSWVAWDGINPTSTFSTFALNSPVSNRYITVVTCSGGSGLTIYRPYAILTNNTTTGYVGVSAEL